MKTKLLLLITAVLLSSCMTQKKQQRIATAYMHSHPVELATLCNIHFKPQTIFKEGKPIHTSDTTYLPGEEIPCPEGASHVQCPPQKTIRDTVFRTDTMEIVDKASIAVLLDQINTLSISEAVLKNELSNSRKANRNKTWWIIGLGLAVLGLGWKRF